MNHLHNFGSLAEIDLPVSVEAEAVADVPAVAEFRKETYWESEAEGEEFLLPTRPPERPLLNTQRQN